MILASMGWWKVAMDRVLIRDTAAGLALRWQAGPALRPGSSHRVFGCYTPQATMPHRCCKSWFIVMLVPAFASCPARHSPPPPQSPAAAASITTPAPASPFVSFALAGQDHGPFIPDPLGGANTQAICHKLEVKDFPAGWPTGLRVPANSYAPHPGERIKAGAPGNYDVHDTLQLFIHLHTPHAEVERFFKTELSQLGTLTRQESPADTGAVWTGGLRCEPRDPTFAQYKVGLMRMAGSPDWTIVIVDAYVK